MTEEISDGQVSETQAEESYDDSNDLAGGDYEETTTQETDVVETKESKETVEEDKTEYTEKGTKLDPNPQSAVHQELANAKRKVQQYEQVLTDKAMLTKYAQQSGLTISEAKAELKEEQKEVENLFKPENLQTVGAVSDALNKLNESFTQKASKYEQEIERLNKQLGGLDSERKTQRAVSSMQTDITSAREKYPELDPKSSNYDADLEKEIGDLYAEIDTDPRTGQLKGSYSLIKLVDRIMGATKKARASASKEANTQIVTKQSGKVRVSQKKTSQSVSDSDMSPGDTIAKRIAKLYK